MFLPIYNFAYNWILATYMILYNRNKNLNQTIECEDIEILKAGKNLRFWNIFARFYLTIRSVGDQISRIICKVRSTHKKKRASTNVCGALLCMVGICITDYLLECITKLTLIVSTASSMLSKTAFTAAASVVSSKK